ncbi:MAG: MerR family transcriptional regulator [Selenomonas sp.]|uniref:MerR family transcriptional regulator n=1 Tax=Selenomonas sp. TaxID=2053611 RepID=UPI0025CF3C50|nr:MerR family transcriptional regulator [Selenomonas sp.]MCR5757823.1 MerR family transcriptional regulator [Selenomonas sp.]
MARYMSFHIGEFAKMTGVNKRTLHYYDAEGIFSPDSVEANGYRSYSSRQIYPFYMIRMFRNMGLDLAEIKDYMQGRTPAKYDQLLAEQEEWLNQEIVKLKSMRQMVVNQRHILHKAREVALDKVEEQVFPDRRLHVSEKLRQLFLRQDREGVERQFAAHLRGVMDGQILSGYTFGAMVSPEDFMQPGHEQIVSYYYVLTDKSWRHIPPEYRRLRKGGRFLVTYFSGDYMNTADSYARLRKYMQEHHLQPAGFSYEESLIEDMSTADAQDFITSIAVPVVEKSW